MQEKSKSCGWFISFICLSELCQIHFSVFSTNCHIYYRGEKTITLWRSSHQKKKKSSLGNASEIIDGTNKIGVNGDDVGHSYRSRRPGQRWETFIYFPITTNFFYAICFSGLNSDLSIIHSDADDCGVAANLTQGERWEIIFYFSWNISYAIVLVI